MFAGVFGTRCGGGKDGKGEIVLFVISQGCDFWDLAPDSLFFLFFFWRHGNVTVLTCYAL